MDMQDQVRETLRAELERQAADSGGRLTVARAAQDGLRVEGEVDLAALAMAVVGHLAGGP